MLRHLIFDFDGLIVDTETAIYQAWQELFDSQGHDLPLSTYVQCVGSTFHSYDPMADLECRVGRKIEWAPLLARKDERIRQLHLEMDALPGIRDLLEQAQEAGVQCAVASSSEPTWVIPWLERLNLRTYFRHICCRDGVLQAKPAPDLFLAAMNRLQVGPDESLVLEDSANGLKAAVAAKVPCLIIPNQVTQHSDFSQAAAVLPTLAGISLHHLWEKVDYHKPCP